MCRLRVSRRKSNSSAIFEAVQAKFGSILVRFDSSGDKMDQNPAEREIRLEENRWNDSAAQYLEDTLFRPRLEFVEFGHMHVWRCATAPFPFSCHYSINGDGSNAKTQRCQGAKDSCLFFFQSPKGDFENTLKKMISPLRLCSLAALR